MTGSPRNIPTDFCQSSRDGSWRVPNSAFSKRAIRSSIGVSSALNGDLRN